MKRAAGTEKTGDEHAGRPGSCSSCLIHAAAAAAPPPSYIAHPDHDHIVLVKRPRTGHSSHEECLIEPLPNILLAGDHVNDRDCANQLNYDGKGGSTIKEADQRNVMIVDEYNPTSSTAHVQQENAVCSTRGTATARGGQQDYNCAHEDDGDELDFDDGDDELEDDDDDGFTNAGTLSPISRSYADIAGPVSLMTKSSMICGNNDQENNVATEFEESAPDNGFAAASARGPRHEYSDHRGCSQRYSQHAAAGDHSAQVPPPPDQHLHMITSHNPPSQFTYLIDKVPGHQPPDTDHSHDDLSADCLHGPRWLREFIATEFFTGSPCPLHNKSIKYFKWDFAKGASELLCMKCKQNYKPSPFSICLQVRRASNLDSIHKQELTQYMDTGGIFTFIINGEDIHYLRSTYPVKPIKGARAYCMACNRALKEKREDEVVCSVQCKLDAIHRGIMPPHLSRLAAFSRMSNMANADGPQADSVQTNNALHGVDDHEMFPNYKEGCTDMLRLLREYDIDVSEKNWLLKLCLKLEGFDESSIGEDWKRNVLNKLESEDTHLNI